MTDNETTMQGLLIESQPERYRGELTGRIIFYARTKEHGRLAAVLGRGHDEESARLDWGRRAELEQHSPRNP